MQKLKQEKIEQQKLEIFNDEFVRLSLISQESNLVGDSSEIEPLISQTTTLWLN